MRYGPSDETAHPINTARQPFDWVCCKLPTAIPIVSFRQVGTDVHRQCIIWITGSDKTDRKAPLQSHYIAGWPQPAVSSTALDLMSAVRIETGPPQKPPKLWLSSSAPSEWC